MTVPSSEKHIGQYKILRTLGAGGMGTVYLGEHLLLGRRAAIKTLLPSLSSHREIVERFFTEARAISAISDPGVVQIYDFGYHVDGTAYIVMEFLEGESLAARLERYGKLRIIDALRLARQLASALGAAHERDIVHRDLKPGNVFVVRDPEVAGGERAKILDFGICKLGEPDSATTTQVGTMLGTPVYMSPEQCRGTGYVDHRSDLYSLGCVLFHLVTGRPPFVEDGVGDYIAAHLKEPPPIPSSIDPAIPEAIDTLLLLCLAKDPDHRYQSMTELQDAIEDVIATTSESDVIELSTPKPTTPLGEGFQSWFVDSLLPISPSNSSAYDVVRPRGRWGWSLALLTALLVGVGGGLVGTQYVLDTRAANEVPAPSAPAVATVEEVEPSVTASVHEIAPPEPVADVELKPPPVKKVEARKPERRAKAPTPQPRSRRVVRQPQPPPKSEDLYDRR